MNRVWCADLTGREIIEYFMCPLNGMTASHSPTYTYDKAFTSTTFCVRYFLFEMTTIGRIQ